MVALFLDDNRTNDDGDGDGKENGKNNMFLFIFYISLPSLHRRFVQAANKSRTGSQSWLVF